MSDLPDVLRRAVVAEVYIQAADMDWDGLTDRQRSAVYDRWLDDPNIGSELTRFLSRERARVWLKDVPMKEYARARSGIGVYSDLAIERLPNPSQIAEQVLGRDWGALDGTIHEKPNRCLVSDGQEMRLMIWGPPKAMRDLIWAGINAVAAGLQPRPLLIVGISYGNVLADSEKQRNIRLGEIVGLEVRHTVLRVTRLAPRRDQIH
jgi:hypothetical protein